MPKRMSCKAFIGAWVGMLLFCLAIWAGVIYGAYLIIKAVFTT